MLIDDWLDVLKATQGEEQLAADAGVHRTTVNKWFNDKENGAYRFLQALRIWMKKYKARITTEGEDDDKTITMCTLAKLLDSERKRKRNE